MDTAKYENEILNQLNNREVYEVLKADPTSRLQIQLRVLLNEALLDGVIDLDVEEEQGKENKENKKYKDKVKGKENKENKKYKDKVKGKENKKCKEEEKGKKKKKYKKVDEKEKYKDEEKGKENKEKQQYTEEEKWKEMLKENKKFVVDKSKRSEMVWGKKNLILLFITLDGIFCSIFEPKCSTPTCQCGETVTITCTLTHPLKRFSLEHCDEQLPQSPLPTKGMFTCNDKIFIEWTEDEVKVKISDAKFSDQLKYHLTLIAKGSAGYDQPPLKITVKGTCKPEISKNSETEEVVCKTESESDASIVWIDNHRKIYPETRMNKPEQLNTGFKLQSFLKVTEEIGDNQICCYVSNPIDAVYKENESCLPDTSAIRESSSSSSPTPSVVGILLAVAVAAVAVVYLFTKKRNFINKVFRHSQGPILKDDALEEENELQPPV
ncbi:uncharacterized protein [Eleutherodactylus coqui]|uniref:uncharacterized protein n=1 Tax=Eleutherodactylus coqui TaxID=57060 RepID=UPI00346312AE